MANIYELVKRLQKLDDQIVACMKCGMCQAVCSLYTETGHEADVARGKIALVENLSKEILRDPRAAKERLDRCLLCGSCAAGCPSGVDALGIFLQARTIITGYLGLSPAKKLVLRGLLSHPDRFDELVKWIARIQDVFLKSANQDLGSSCARVISPLIGDRHVIPLSGNAWHKRGHRDFKRSRDNSKFRVVFYPGCLVDKVLPRVADAAIRALEFHDVDVFVPPQVPCCGIPALSAGDSKTFEALVKRNIDTLDALDYDFLVTPCATCTATIKKIWPSMSNYFPEAIKDKIFIMSQKTKDISEFLVEIADLHTLEGSCPANKTITYHDPCHLKKSLGIAKQPRLLMVAAGNFNFVEMSESDRCCGMGGSFGLEHYELSRKIGQKKLDSILETGADAVATGCPACMLQIIDLLSHAGRSISVKHPVEVYAEAIKHLLGNRKEPAQRSIAK